MVDRAKPLGQVDKAKEKGKFSRQTGLHGSTTVAVSAASRRHLSSFLLFFSNAAHIAIVSSLVAISIVQANPPEQSLNQRSTTRTPREGKEITTWRIHGRRHSSLRYTEEWPVVVLIQQDRSHLKAPVAMPLAVPGDFL
ncbi:hypothetical protein BJX96DRAFT_66001 [Aspergillus floccosus]